MSISRLAFILAAAFVLSGCAAAQQTSPAAQTTQSAVEESEDRTTAEDKKAEGSAEDTKVEESALGSSAAAGTVGNKEEESDGQTADLSAGAGKTEEFVRITIPTVYEEISSQKEAEQIKEKNGYESAVLEEDGSLTITMSRSRHEEMLRQFRESVDAAIREITSADDGSLIEKIEYNDDYSVFTVTVSGDEIGTADRQTAEELVMYGTLYHIYSGNDTDHIKVEYVSSETGEVIESADSGNLGNAY